MKALLFILLSCFFLSCSSGSRGVVGQKIGQDLYAHGSLIRMDFGISQCYLIPMEEGQWCMIDTGFPEDFPPFLEALEVLTIEPHEIRFLLLTHAHDDHVGFAAALREISPCRVIVHEKSLPFLTEGEMPHVGMESATPLISLLGRIFSLFTQRTFTFEPLVLEEGDILVRTQEDLSLESLGIPGKVMGTPGHTEDSISLILEDGSVFCGDAAMNYLRLAGADYRPIFYYDFREVMESWSLIARHNGRIIYPTHGDPFPVEILQERVERHSTDL